MTEADLANKLRALVKSLRVTYGGGGEWNDGVNAGLERAADALEELLELEVLQEREELLWREKFSEFRKSLEHAGAAEEEK